MAILPIVQLGDPILRTPASLGLLGSAGFGVRVGYQPTVVVVLVRESNP